MALRCLVGLRVLLYCDVPSLASWFVITELGSIQGEETGRGIDVLDAVNPFRTAVPFWDKPLKFQLVCPQNGSAVLKGLTPLAPHSHMWGQSTLSISSLSPKRDWGPKRVNPPYITGLPVRDDSYYGGP